MELLARSPHYPPRSGQLGSGADLSQCLCPTRFSQLLPLRAFLFHSLNSVPWEGIVRSNFMSFARMGGIKWQESQWIEVNTVGKVSDPDMGTKTKGTSCSLLRTSWLGGCSVRHTTK